MLATRASWVTSSRVCRASRSSASCAQDVARRPAVEVARRLVGQDHEYFVDQRSRDGDALTLAAGQAVGQCPARSATRSRSSSESAFPACLVARRAEEQGGKLDVLDRGELVDQVERLEDEPDVPAAGNAPPGPRGPVHPFAREPNLSRVWTFEPTEQMQEGSTCRRRSHDRHGLALLEEEVDLVDRAYRRLLRIERLHQILRFDHRVHLDSFSIYVALAGLEPADVGLQPERRTLDKQCARSVRGSARLELLQLPECLQELELLRVHERGGIGRSGRRRGDELEVELDRRDLRPRHVVHPASRSRPAAVNS